MIHLTRMEIGQHGNGQHKLNDKNTRKNRKKNCVSLQQLVPD